MKVMYFDYWTRGIGHFVAIDERLRATGATTLLMHLGSIREECPKQEIIRGIECRDIGYYNTRWIYDVLAQEKPDVVLTLNARTLFDRALVTACRALQIPTVFMAHGIDPFADQIGEAVKVYEKSVNKLGFLLPRIGKYLSFIIPNYLHAVCRSRSEQPGIAHALSVVLAYARNPGRAVQLPPVPEDLLHDRHLLFSNRAVRYWEEAGFASDHLFAVGNPKYDRLLERRGKFRSDDLPTEVRAWIEAGQKYALILEEALVEAGEFGGWTKEYRNRYLDDVGRAAKRMGFKVALKLHPGTRLEAIQFTHGPIFQLTDLDALISFATFCVCHQSTTIDNCVLLDKPVVQPRWGLSKNLPDYFGALGVTRHWLTPDQDPDLTMDCDRRETYKRDRITVLEPRATQNVIEHLYLAARRPRPLQ